MMASSPSSTATTSWVEPAPYIAFEPLPRKDQASENVAPSASNPEPLDSNATAVLPEQSLWRASLIIGTLSGITLTSSMTTGLLTVALPTMATDLGLSDALLLWPASVYGLTSGCSLMIAGAVADVVGSRIVYLVGCFLLTGFILGSGFAETSTQLIAFRGGQGVAVSMCLPTAMGLLSLYLPKGRRRNLGFAFVGAGQPLGYSLGLFLGGFFVDSIGWKYGWYLSACVAFIVFLIGIFGLPKENAGAVPEDKMRKVVFGIDWVGAILASASLAMLSYVLAVISNDTSSIKEAPQIVLLSIALACIPAFAFWMEQQKRRGKPALIPNSLWKTTAFSSICVMVLLTWAILQSIEYLLSLYFQRVQGVSAIQTSLYFIPNIIIVAPLLMAVNDPDWSYWYASFLAVLLSPLSGDILFVVSALIITSTFPDNTQALAGAVFSTFSQFGTTVGLTVVAVISSSVSQSSAASHTHSRTVAGGATYSPQNLLKGYQASFWALFGAAVLTCAIGAFGLRDVSNKGMKKD
ncbi:hypothetical protein DL764_000847 [Monosporascus ibericus]|uniref:Major facilitator superfamily (MFS) profile domain-containing protein n=1 Tax=Monosporascus ibericus TaxID=155417 RepID=A0A4Q4TVB0_9PEZI|nr:hypothetical protein DL764_000847 [Monosporascus ibericus]